MTFTSFDMRMKPVLQEIDVFKIFFIHEPERYDEINFYYVGEGVSKNNNRNMSSKISKI